MLSASAFGSAANACLDLDHSGYHTNLIQLLCIINLSIQSRILSTDLKVASVKPLLKKHSLSSDKFKNFRPISNLSFLSKAVEKCVVKQLIDYLVAR